MGFRGLPCLAGYVTLKRTAAGHITGSQVQLHLGAPHVCFFARDGWPPLEPTDNGGKDKLTTHESAV